VLQTSNARLIATRTSALRWSLHVKRIIRREDMRAYFERAFAAKFPPITWKMKVEMFYEALLGMRHPMLVAPLDQQSTTERANPASLVSLYLLFMSLAVWARACTVASKSTRCLDAISLLAIA
jgi:hypothetical protein